MVVNVAGVLPTLRTPYSTELARWSDLGEYSVMATLTIDLEDDLARHVEDSARREHKSVSEWVKDRVKPEADRAAALAAIEARAVANGHPPGWLTLFGSLADDNTFAAPPRGATRPVGSFNGD